jgi:hypothetical protein
MDPHTCAGSGAGKAKKATAVMFLFRIVFWLGLAVLLLPTEETQQARLYDTASATVERIATFCDRNPKTCAAGAEFWSTFLKKAEFGARVAADLITSRGQRSEAPAQTAAPRPSGAATVEPRPASAPRNTLSRDDLGPAWRAPAPRAGA